MLRYLVFAPLLLSVGCPFAAAQEFVPPRFEGLEQQQQNIDQYQLDRLESRRQAAQIEALTNGSSASEAALRDIEIRNEINRLTLQGRIERQQVANQRAAETAQLPNRRIASYSSLVIHDPERYALPLAPAGQYYARLDGRFVLVDATSEMVVRVLDSTIFDPLHDRPTDPRPALLPPVARN